MDNLLKKSQHKNRSLWYGRDDYNVCLEIFHLFKNTVTQITYENGKVL